MKFKQTKISAYGLIIVLLNSMSTEKLFAQSQVIELQPFAQHVLKVQADTIWVTGGKTQIFSVDSPENQEFVNTNPSLEMFVHELKINTNLVSKYQFLDAKGGDKNNGKLEEGDRFLLKTAEGKKEKVYWIKETKQAVGGILHVLPEELSANISTDLSLHYTIGQRTPDATVKITIPKGINITLDNTTVNVIGRGEVLLQDLPYQSIGRVGTDYPYAKVGDVQLLPQGDGSTIIMFTHLDLRPSNGDDLILHLKGVKLNKVGKYLFKARYSTTKPYPLESSRSNSEEKMLLVKSTITDFTRVLNKSIQYKETPQTYNTICFQWSPFQTRHPLEIWQSTNHGKSWTKSIAQIDQKLGRASISHLASQQWHLFKLKIKEGPYKGYSNEIVYYSGKLDVKVLGVKGDGRHDDTEKINQAIALLNHIGGGTLLFSNGTYLVRTIHLQSNVYLYLSKGATIKAIAGSDEPEETWFSDKKYRSGLSPTDPKPYENPENWLTKQDVGHTFFHNAMFFGERLDNIKIIGTGLITGDGVLSTSDKVMNNVIGKRADKMFSLKLCTRVEIGGVYHPQDLWYDKEKDQPYYIGKADIQLFDDVGMLKIERSGHFVLLATGTDSLNVHDTYFGKYNNSNVRDIYDFMACNHVRVTNIFCKVSSDDIVKPGSDCSLGFTRPATDYKVRNIIGDTNCNLFQIGSETADDITHICVDNIYVLGANKAGFSISTNDGGTVSDIHLNCGETGPLHHRSKILRATTPFFISISNRGRILGADVKRFKFIENGIKHDELLVTNVNIGSVKNITLNGVDVSEVFGGSSFKKDRWSVYDGSQRKASPIIAGYSLPADSLVEGGLGFKLPNRLQTGYIENLTMNDIHFLFKGGNAVQDASFTPPELGVGQYNVSNLKVQPAYGVWARHVKNLLVENCTFNTEKEDQRYAIYLDDVLGATIENVKMVMPDALKAIIKLKNARDVKVLNATYFDQIWGKNPQVYQSPQLLLGKDARLPER